MKNNNYKKARFESVKDFMLDLRLGVMLSMLSVGDFLRSKVCYTASVVSGLFAVLLLFGVYDAQVLGITAIIIPATTVHTAVLVATVLLCVFFYWCWCLSVGFDELLQAEEDVAKELSNARS